MLRKLQPKGLRANPNYSQGIEVGPGQRLVAVAGQTGQRGDGSVPDGIAEQADLAWANVMTVLKEAGMGPEHIVHYTSYLVAGTPQRPYDAARLRHLGAARPASTAAAPTSAVRTCAAPTWASP